jgi:hypothetical protein
MSLLPLGLLSQGGASGGFAYEQIATAFGTGSSGTITFASIPNTYRHLQVRFTARLDGNTTVGMPINVRYNGQASTYVGQMLKTDTVSNPVGVDVGGNVICFAPALSGAADSFVAGVFELYDYNSANKNATSRTLAGYTNGGTTPGVISGVNMVSMGNVTRTTTTSITQLEFISGLGNFVSASRFSLYGIRG